MKTAGGRTRLYHLTIDNVDGAREFYHSRWLGELLVQISAAQNQESQRRAKGQAHHVGWLLEWTVKHDLPHEIRRFTWPALPVDRKEMLPDDCSAPSRGGTASTHTR